MDMEELGYFIFMEEQEEEAKQENEEREALRQPRTRTTLKSIAQSNANTHGAHRIRCAPWVLLGLKLSNGYVRCQCSYRVQSGFLFMPVQVS